MKTEPRSSKIYSCSSFYYPIGTLNDAQMKFVFVKKSILEATTTSGNLIFPMDYKTCNFFKGRFVRRLKMESTKCYTC